MVRALHNVFRTLFWPVAVCLTALGDSGPFFQQSSCAVQRQARACCFGICSRVWLTQEQKCPRVAWMRAVCNVRLHVSQMGPCTGALDLSTRATQSSSFAERISPLMQAHGYCLSSSPLFPLFFTSLLPPYIFCTTSLLCSERILSCSVSVCF